MKTWMRILVWAGIGCGIGTLIGFQIGKNYGYNERDDEYNEALTQAYAEAEEAIRTYRGEDSEEDIPEMPMEVPVIDELDEVEEVYEGKNLVAPPPAVPKFHEQQLLPVTVEEEEYDRNIEEYDKENLIYYAMDDVLYNERVQKVEECQEDVVGIGTLMQMPGDPNNPIDHIFVRNDTAGTYYRIDYVDAAFCDAVMGYFPPTEDETEE